MSAKKMIVRVALTVVVLLVVAPILAIALVALSSLAHAAEPTLGKVQACEQACREPKKAPVKKKPRPSPCATVEFTVVPEDEVRFVILAKKRLPSSFCWQMCDGKDCAAPPSPCDDCDWIGPKSVIATGFEPLHSGRYIARSAKQKLRFPRAAMVDYIALCVTRAGLGQSDSWIVPPKAWHGKSVVSVPYGGQQWPAWGQYDPSKWSSVR